MHDKHPVQILQEILSIWDIAHAERDGTRAETRFRLSPKRTSPFKSVGSSVQSTAGSRGVRISFSNARYTTFGGGVRVLATHSIRQFPLHFPFPCVTVCHQVPNELYQTFNLIHMITTKDTKMAHLHRSHHITFLFQNIYRIFHCGALTDCVLCPVRINLHIFMNDTPLPSVNSKEELQTVSRNSISISFPATCFGIYEKQSWCN